MKMTKEKYCKQHAELMGKWQMKHGADIGMCGFAEDGIVSPNVWFSTSYNGERIMLLLKEAYTVENPKLVWDEAKWLAHKKCMNGCKEKCEECTITGNTFNRAAEWVYGISSAEHGNYLEYDAWLGVKSRKMKDYYFARDELLSRIAIVNVKKSNGVSQSNNDELYYYAAWDKDYLINQIELIQPTVIICGGTYGMLRCLFTQLPELENINDGATMLGNIKVIASCHPNARNTTKKNMYETIMKNYINF